MHTWVDSKGLEKRGTEIIEELVRKKMLKICDPVVSRSEKRKMLADLHVGGGIFNLLLGIVLPLLVSAYVK